MSTQKLPNEVIQMIVGNLVPSMWDKASLPASHVITKTLIALTRVCWATYPRATDLLWQYCLRIDSNNKALKFSQCLQSTSVEKIFHHCRHVRLYLEPFEEPSEEPFEEPLKEVESPSEAGSSSGSANDTPEPSVIRFSCYGGSSDESSFSPSPKPPLADMQTAIVVRDILLTLAPVLKCLIIDMPLRSLYPEYDKEGIRPILRHGFEALVHLEEFVSIRDELFLAIVEDETEHHVWATCWPKLRRLALYNLDMDPEEGAWLEIVGLPCLELGVFTRADGSRFGEVSEDDAEQDDAEQEWVASLSHVRAQARRTLQHDGSSLRSLSLVFVDCVEHPELFTWFASGLDWKSGDITLHVHFISPSVYGPGTSPEDVDPREICQDWVKRQALDGTLWEEIFSVCEVP
ncbi:hypothetical protein B0J13DRAFT_549640 [Dactylonectria estremocensis]|uniref:Uncharacterized protein n=1 Tax=Dactylonectria estremocensis TaxID=1079267 RepID=A0A9P9J6K2_9HYPO|nr:hypothetical protein B0J13DRAFT_549640 [Dactylonectria estremocensis]